MWTERQTDSNCGVSGGTWLLSQCLLSVSDPSCWNARGETQPLLYPVLHVRAQPLAPRRYAPCPPPPGDQLYCPSSGAATQFLVHGGQDLGSPLGGESQRRSFWGDCSWCPRPGVAPVGSHPPGNLAWPTSSLAGTSPEVLKSGRWIQQERNRLVVFLLAKAAFASPWSLDAPTPRRLSRVPVYLWVSWYFFWAGERMPLTDAPLDWPTVCTRPRGAGRVDTRSITSVLDTCTQEAFTRVPQLLRGRACGQENVPCPARRHPGPHQAHR